MTATAFGDFMQPFQLEGPRLRGRLVRLEAALAPLLDPHAYPTPVAALVAEASVLAAALAGGLKYEGVFTLQLQGDGPVGLMLIDVGSDGNLRGYARVAGERLAAAGGDTASLPRLLGAGVMAFTVDQGPDTERYQGVVALEGATLSDCAHAYFRQSEQLDTAIRVCASDPSAADSGRRAAALMLQRLPGAAAADDDEDDWRRAVILMSSVRPAELLDAGLTPGDLLYRLFHEDGVRLYRRRPLGFRCRCSRQRVDRTLRSLPYDELVSLFTEDDRLTVTCEFCKATYGFDRPAIDALFARS